MLAAGKAGAIRQVMSGINRKAAEVQLEAIRQVNTPLDPAPSRRIVQMMPVVPSPRVRSC